MLIGLHGKAGSGKDTVFHRLCILESDMYVFARIGFADILKESVASLFDVTVEEIDEWKRYDDAMVCIGHTESKCMTIREMLQRYGTESHRNVFGNNFWVDIGISKALYLRKNSLMSIIPVFTDVRFANEAEAIINNGGEVWHIISGVGDTNNHVSETVIDDSLITRVINNTIRDDGFYSLDRQLQVLVDSLHAD